jgi:hypothetical protein
MKAKACRDCGNLLAPNARGCARCALNFEAERMIDQFVWRRVTPGLIILVILLAGLLFYFVR